MRKLILVEFTAVHKSDTEPFTSFRLVAVTAHRDPSGQQIETDDQLREKATDIFIADFDVRYGNLHRKSVVAHLTVGAETPIEEVEKPEYFIASDRSSEVYPEARFAIGFTDGNQSEFLETYYGANMNEAVRSMIDAMSWGRSKFKIVKK